MVSLRVPSVACVIGEGGSGGAVALGVSDRVLMQENAIYSVITPEGCAAILCARRRRGEEGGRRVKPDARHCLELGVIDDRLEPPGGAQNDPDAAAALQASPSRCASSRCPAGGAGPPAAPSSGRWGSTPEVSAVATIDFSTKFPQGFQRLHLDLQTPKPTIRWARRPTPSGGACSSVLPSPGGANVDRARPGTARHNAGGMACSTRTGASATGRRRRSRSAATAAPGRRSSSSSATRRAGSTTTRLERGGALAVGCAQGRPA
jgi:hypothetical protein